MWLIPSAMQSSGSTSCRSSTHSTPMPSRPSANFPRRLAFNQAPTSSVAGASGSCAVTGVALGICFSRISPARTASASSCFTSPSPFPMVHRVHTFSPQTFTGTPRYRVSSSIMMPIILRMPPTVVGNSSPCNNSASGTLSSMARSPSAWMRPKACPALPIAVNSGAFMLRTSPPASNDVAHLTSRAAPLAMTCWHCVISRGPVKPSTMASGAGSRNSPRMTVCLSPWMAPIHATSSPDDAMASATTPLSSSLLAMRASSASPVSPASSSASRRAGSVCGTGIFFVSSL
mmetsp:Transcript_7312/g.20355  ORF Transcript_7312/g.20355 Transcript_7312/m.20355 type:complete len:289 (+) Transcript_7312:61-927(+)